MLKGTHNFWTKDVQRNEESYDRQEVRGLEDEKRDLIAQCAQLEHEIAFLCCLQRHGRVFVQTGKPSQIKDEASAPMSKSDSRSKLIDRRFSENNKRLDLNSSKKGRPV